MKFSEYLNFIPYHVKRLILHYYWVSENELIRIMETGDVDDDRRIEFGHKINLIKQQYNEGLFGPPEKAI